MAASLNILVVDDNPEILMMFKEFLSLDGHRVRTFEDGETALAGFREDRPDIVITDLGMPEISGWQVAETVRKESIEIPIIFITAVSNQVDPALVQRLHIAEVVRKPFKIGQIKDLIYSLT